MISLIVVLLFTTLTAWIAGYREVESLIRDGSWYGIWFRIKFWKAKWNLDSYHFMGGLRRLLNVSAFLVEIFWAMMFGYLLVDVFFFIDVLTTDIGWAVFITVMHIPAYWWFWYYQRNIFMHILSRKKEYRQRKYLNPFQIKKEK